MDKQYTNKINKLKQLIDQPKQIVILTHKNPDGDAVGSSTGLYHFLVSRGHQVNIIIPNDIPEFLMWVPGCEHIHIHAQNKERTEKIIQDAELIFYLDFNSVSRIDKIYKNIKDTDVPGVMIDHHPNPEYFATVVFSDTTASATAELVYRIILDVTGKEEVSQNIAIGLFVGIMTDTGCFSYNSSNPVTYLAIANLLRTGIDKDDIFSKVYDNYSFQRLRMLGHSLKNKMEYFPEYRTGIISLTARELDEYEYNIGDTEGFVNYPLTIKDVIFSALFIEKKDMVKISFRSKGKFPVNRFSSNHFNGGGHLNAAGGESYESLANVLNRFKGLLEKYKNDLLKS